MTCGEALRLINLLWSDPASMLASSVAGWDFPLSREASATLDLYDAFVTFKTPAKKRPPLHTGRPYKPQRAIVRSGNTAGQSREDVEARLKALRRGEIQFI